VPPAGRHAHSIGRARRLSQGRGIDHGGTAPNDLGVEEFEESEKVFQDAVNAGDLDGLLSLYEPEAVFVPAPDQVARGLNVIRQAWTSLLDLGARFELTAITRHQVRDIMLETDQWKFDGIGPDGNPASRRWSIAANQMDHGVCSSTTHSLLDKSGIVDPHRNVDTVRSSRDREVIAGYNSDRAHRRGWEGIPRYVQWG
jgi:ketosteroid isomerase-like protein